MEKRKIAIVITNRSEYSRLKSVIKAIEEHNGLELVLILSSACLLDKYGILEKEIRADGFMISEKLYTMIDGGNNLTMAKTAGMLLIEMAQTFYRHKPDIALVMGDRFEALSIATAAAFLNVHVAHIQGGEVTGTIDEMIRHSVTKLSHIHFPSNDDAADRIHRLGEARETIFTVGCPSVDTIKGCSYSDNSALFENIIVRPKDGRFFKPDESFLLVVQHPVTTAPDSAEKEIIETLKAIEDIGMQTIMLWPNPDAGSDKIAVGIRHYLLENPIDNLFLYKHLPVNVFMNLAKNAACIVGNSSAGVREACYFGTPVVNIGSRQQGRLRTTNVIDVPHDSSMIREAVLKHLSNGKYPIEEPYGQGDSARKIADILASVKLPSVQKTIRY